MGYVYIIVVQRRIFYHDDEVTNHIGKKLVYLTTEKLQAKVMTVENSINKLRR